MSEEMKTEGTDGALEFLLARLQSEIDEVDDRLETLFKKINELKARNRG